MRNNYSEQFAKLKEEINTADAIVRSEKSSVCDDALYGK